MFHLHIAVGLEAALRTVENPVNANPLFPVFGALLVRGAPEFR